MKRRPFWKCLFSVLLSAGAGYGLLRGAEAARNDRPPIVVFLTDDQGQLDSTPYGARELRTPNMQQLVFPARKLAMNCSCLLC